MPAISAGACYSSTMGGFYRRWLRTAFRHALGPIDLWTGLSAAVLGIVDHYNPGRHLVTEFAWQIPIWALAAVALVRLIAAPWPAPGFIDTRLS